MNGVNFISKSLNSRARHASKIFSTYSNVVLLFICVSIVSFSISQFVSNRLAMDFYPNNMGIADSASDSELNFSEVVVKKGDSFSKILESQNVRKRDAIEIMAALKKSSVKFSLKPGNVITFSYEISEDDIGDDSLNDYVLSEIVIKTDNVNSIVITKKNGNYILKEITAELLKKFVRHNITINSSFISSLSKVGISAGNIQDIVNAYSYEVDFQRHIKKGDTISIICEKFYTEDGEFAQSGKVIFASLNLSGKDHKIYWFKGSGDGSGQYYSESGKTVKRSLLRTPINVAKISSKFGMRKHPVLGFTKMHKGVDFQAPMGTPILAAGDGVVKDIGYRGAYGNIIKIRHSSSLTTAYAHASKFPKNLRVGSKVKQGQVIAYVGRTGRATGPHCHFEVIINGKHVNPMSVQTTPGMELKGHDLKLFTEHKKKIQKYHTSLREGKPAELAGIDHGKIS